MLTKGSSNVGGRDDVASSTIIGSFSNAFAVPGTSNHAIESYNSNGLDMDDFLGLAGGSTSIGDPISTFRPQLKDLELQRRARNNAILAKIQELEANASVQAARSERLRMMREEYESLVRKYASSRKTHWGTTSSGYLNENNNNSNGYPPSRYLQPLSSPFISIREPIPAAQQLLLSAHTVNPSTQPTRDIPSNINRSFATTGVNTDITGPVKSVVISGDDNFDDLRHDLNLEKRRSTTIIDNSTQTEAVPEKAKQHQQVGTQVETTVVASCEGSQAAVLLPSVLASVHAVYGETANQNAIVMEGEDIEKETLSLRPKKNLSNKVDMMLMMLDEEDDESSYQAKQKRKQELEAFHQQLHQPKTQLRNDTNSISSPPSSSVVDVLSTSNVTTEEVELKQRLRQKQQLEKASSVEHDRKYQKKQNNNNEMEDETSQDTATISLANNNNNNNNSRSKDHNVASNAFKDARLSDKIFLGDDISLSDSTSAFQVHDNKRKKLLEQLVKSSTKNSRIKNKREDGGGDDVDKDQQENSHNESSEDGDEERSAFKSNDKRSGSNDVHGCSSPTAGATSESIGDSMMDSIQKTPDALLPRDDYEVHETAEVKEKEHVVTVTAVSADTKISRSGVGESKPFRNQPGVNDKVSDSREMRLKQEPSTSTPKGTKDLERLELHKRQINDAEEIRLDNLSSSKLDVPAKEEKNFAHANNPTGDPYTGNNVIIPVTYEESRSLSSHREKSNIEEKKPVEKENPVTSSKVEYDSMEKELFATKNPGFAKSSLLEKQIASDGDTGARNGRNTDTGASNDSSKKKDAKIYSPAPPVNMSTHSSTTSSFSSGSNVVDNGRTNDTAIPSSVPASTNLPQRQSSTGSSSTSSSRQHSLDDQVDGNKLVRNSNNVSETKEQSNSSSHHDHSSAPLKEMQEQEHQSSMLPQSTHKRHQQLLEQVKTEREEKETTPPMGADVMPERLSSSTNLSFFKVAELEAAPSAATSSLADNMNNERKVSPSVEKGGTSVKTTKASATGSPLAIHTLTASPSSRKIGSTNVSNSSGNNANGSGAQSGTRPTSGKFSKMTIKQGQAAVIVPSGPTGAQNTARRVRLKLHEDSDTDSSEIGSVKSQNAPVIKGNQPGHQNNASSGFGPGSKSAVEIHTSEKKSDANKKHLEIDDDFDDFYDNF